jgi:serine phosphatase RsbU (regulator of sigma subunit)
MMPESGEPVLSDWMGIEAKPEPVRLPLDDSAGRDPALAEACEIVARALKLDGCAALARSGAEWRPVPGLRPGPGPLPGPELGRLAERLAPGVSSIDQAALENAEREALERAGVAWLLPVDVPVRAVLLLGRRLAGTWLTRHEILDLDRFAHHLAVTLENAELKREARNHGVIERELREAGAIQAHLLPRRAPVFPTLDCAAATLSCEPVGGDYYDFVQGAGPDLTLVVGDAAGKGVPAALLLAQVQARFRSHAQRGASPGGILGALNEDLVRLDQPEKFVGLLCARVDVRAGRVWFANGGITPPLIRRADGRTLEVLSGGVLLGVSPAASYPDACVELDAGDLVVVYTDGLTEARRGEELYETDRLREVLDRHHQRRAADVLDAILESVRAFADRPLDDLTVVVIKQLTRPLRAAAPSGPRFGLKKRSLSADAVT